MNIEGPENVRDIFSIFHDGTISSCALNGCDLTLEIEIQYLAERVRPENSRTAGESCASTASAQRSWTKAEQIIRSKSWAHSARGTGMIGPHEIRHNERIEFAHGARLIRGVRRQ